MVIFDFLKIPDLLDVIDIHCISSGVAMLNGRLPIKWIAMMWSRVIVNKNMTSCDKDPRMIIFYLRDLLLSDIEEIVDGLWSLCHLQEPIVKMRIH